MKTRIEFPRYLGPPPQKPLAPVSLSVARADLAAPLAHRVLFVLSLAAFAIVAGGLIGFWL